MYPREYFDTYWRPSLKNEVFVIMSFASEFDEVWVSAIKPAIEQDTPNHPLAHRVDTTTLAGSIITEILDGIAHAKIVLADISVCSSGRWVGQRNGNAMYELGLAHALRPAAELVVVRSDSEQINFDVAGIKIQAYDRNELGTARQIFAHLLRERLADLDQVKHLKTTQAVESLDADCLNLLVGAGRNDFFSVPPAKTMGEVMVQVGNGTKDAVRHLLALGIIRFDANTAAGAYAYHWTDFGRAVLKKLGVL